LSPSRYLVQNALIAAVKFIFTTIDVKSLNTFIKRCTVSNNDYVLLIIISYGYQMNRLRILNQFQISGEYRFSVMNIVTEQQIYIQDSMNIITIGS